MREATSYCRICLGYCGVKVTIDDAERVVKVRGDHDNPLTEGYACIKGLSLPDFQNHSRRVLRPLKRVGDRHVPIDLDQALDEIANKVGALVAESGPEAISVYRGTGAMAAATIGPALTGFAKALGAQFFSSMTIDQSAKWVAAERLGTWAAGKQPFETADVWLFAGSNPLVSVWSWSTPVQNPVKRIKEAKARGLKLIVIDPRRCDIAHFADIHLQINPGEDAAVAAGLLNIILSRGWHDARFCEDHVEGLDNLRDAVAPFTPDGVAARAGIAADDLVAAAEMFARTSRRGSVNTGTGPNMAAFPNLAEHLYECLGVVCGRFMREGDPVPNPGVIRARRARRAEVLGPSRTFEKRPRSRVRGAIRLMGEAATPTLPEEILTPGAGRVRALFVAGGNPVKALPDLATTVRSFEALDLLVALEPMMTATARLAHYVLPPPVAFERPDNTWTLEWTNLSTPYAQYTPPLVPPPTGAQLCSEAQALWGILKRLGKPMRFNGRPLDLDAPPTEDDLLEILSDGDIPYEEIKAATGGRLFDVPPQSVDAGGPGAGRFDVMPADVADELTAYAAVRPEEDADAYDLRLISRRMREVSNSMMHDLAPIRARVPFNPLQVHPDDLDAAGIESGAEVRLLSRHGSIAAVAVADASLKPGVVSMSHSWGGLPGDGDSRGVSVAELLSLSQGTEALQAMPRMSAIPVRIEPS